MQIAQFRCAVFEASGALARLYKPLFAPTLDVTAAKHRASLSVADKLRVVVFLLQHLYDRRGNIFEEGVVRYGMVGKFDKLHNVKLYGLL